jgi:uncharacterized protein
VAMPPPVVAQERVPRRNLLDMLFGGPRYDRRSDGEDRSTRGQRYERRYYRDGSVVDVPLRQRNRSAAPGRAAVPARPPVPLAPAAPEPVAKMENARGILVVGDFMAGGLGGELDTTFAASPGVAVTERSDGSSGLVREDHFDWQTELPTMLDEVKPSVVIVIGDIKEKFRTDAWFKEYEARIAKLAGAVRSRKLPLLWVGLPSFQSPSMMTDAVTLNALYRSQVEKLGGEFVDIWEGFVDEGGKFVTTGSDVNGQQVRLRGSDGITFTKAGKQKLAFYVEKLARRHLGDMASPELVNLDADSLPELGLPATASKALLAHPISLSDPELDGGKELLGAMPNTDIQSQSPRDKLVKRGEMEAAPTGRVDDYRISTTQ